MLLTFIKTEIKIVMNVYDTRRQSDGEIILTVRKCESYFPEELERKIKVVTLKSLLRASVFFSFMNILFLLHITVTYFNCLN